MHRTGDDRLYSHGNFGGCCTDLRLALAPGVMPLIRVEDNGVLVMAVGAMATADGTAWFDQAVLFCPFCGTKLQDREEIARRTAGTTPG
ncbi:MAG TPA: hypothetical protein VFK13_12095 [Gemmatimonadaceae bacterium]|nr:hypothetical protein [Gemmatimonadaceae bacterium]